MAEGDEATKKTCSNPDCNFDIDGRCIEAQDPGTCPFRSGRQLLASTDVDDDDEPGSEDAEAQVYADSSGVALSDGLRLSPADSEPILRTGRNTQISIVAPKAAGKTSLVAGIYELFLEGRSGPILYRGSRTPREFEKLCHLGRAESGQLESEMERTQHSVGLHFLHLELCRNGEPCHLLLADRAGEQFTNAGASYEKALRLSELGRASTLLLLVDGAALADPRFKNLPLSEAVSILDAVTGSGQLSRKPALAIALTKADVLFEATDQQETMRARYDRIAQRLRELYGEHFADIETFETAAMPKRARDRFERGHGLADLLDFLLQDRRSIYADTVEHRTPQRSYEKFGEEHVR